MHHLNETRKLFELNIMTTFRNFKQTTICQQWQINVVRFEKREMHDNMKTLGVGSGKV